jgi:hypothetical protein
LSTVKIPLLIGDSAAEDVLKLAESDIAETLGETGERGGVDASEICELRDGADCRLLWLFDELGEDGIGPRAESDLSFAPANSHDEFTKILHGLRRPRAR